MISTEKNLLLLPAHVQGWDFLAVCQCYLCLSLLLENVESLEVFTFFYSFYYNLQESVQVLRKN